MKVRKVIARNMSEGLRAVSSELGPDAMILSNRRVERGVEIMAAVRNEEASAEAESTPATQVAGRDVFAADPPLSDPLAVPARRARPEPPAPTPEPARTRGHPDESMEESVLRLSESGAGGLSRENLLSLLDRHRDPLEEKRQALRDQLQAEQPTRRQEARPEEARPYGRGGRARSQVAPTLAATPGSAAAPVAPGQQDEVRAMRAELAALRDWLEQRQPEAEVEASALTQALTRLGFDAQCQRPLLERFGRGDTDTAWARAREQLARLLEKDAGCLIRQGGVAALVGPTGAGKTTTLSKLATRFAMQHGAADLGIVSLDQYRIGAHESVRILGRILGCEVKLAEPEDNLEALLTSLRDKRLILIDTNGSERGFQSFRAQLGDSVLEQQIQPFLVLPANLSSHALTQAWQRFGQARPRRVILTKTDESPEVGTVLSLALRKRLPVSYWCDGTQVPQDLHRADIDGLLNHSERALQDVTMTRETQAYFS